MVWEWDSVCVDFRLVLETAESVLGLGYRESEDDVNNVVNREQRILRYANEKMH